jgi:hypothetical protein
MEVPMRELVVATGVALSLARETFLREAGVDPSDLTPFALRAWTMIFFAAPGGLSFREYRNAIRMPGTLASTVLGGITILTRAQELIRDNPALDLSTVLLHEELKGMSAPRTQKEREKGYDIVQRGLISAGEAEILDRTLFNTSGGR